MLCLTNLTNTVKTLRKRKGMRQSDLAKIVGISRQTILGIEKGRLNPSIHICLRIAAILQEPVGDIFTLEPVGPVPDENQSRDDSGQTTAPER